MLSILRDRDVSKEVYSLFNHITQTLAEEFTFNKIDVDLFALSIFSHRVNTCFFELQSDDVPIRKIETELREFCRNKYMSTGYKKPLNKRLTADLESIINRGFEISEEYGDVKTEEPEKPILCIHHILIAILEVDKHQPTKIFKSFDIDKQMLVSIFITKKNISDALSNYDESGVDEFGAEESKPKPQQIKLVVKQSGNLEILNNFCDNVSEMVHDNKIKIFGRDKELDVMFDILSRKTKNNVVLCGPSGVGRTSIIYKLADKINKGDVPKHLRDKKIFLLNISSIVAGTKYRGEFEDRMVNIVKELKNNKNIILFISELHTIVGAGNSTTGLDAAQILKPALSSGDIQIIGTTTLTDYKKVIEADETLNKRFQKIYVDEPTIEESIAIVDNAKTGYEEFHNITYPSNIIESAVKLAKRYLTDRALPDSAFDIIDVMGASSATIVEPNKEIIKLEEDIAEQKLIRLHLVEDQEFDNIPLVESEIEKLENELNALRLAEDEKEKSQTVLATEDMLNKTISKLSGVPINKISGGEIKSLMDLEKTINSKVIGQEEAVKKITNAVIRGRVGFRRDGGTIATILSIGSSGVGKTMIAKKIAEEVFGSEENMIRVDMSEFMEPHSISKLIGAPPGYANSEDGGQITEKIKHKKYCVILWDEIEKAHPVVFNLLLQLFDEGHITDSKGYKIDCKNTINILTSNIGTRQASESGGSIGYTNNSKSADEAKKKSILEKSLKKQFSPEFINRIDEIIYFNSLTDEHLANIITLEIGKFKVIMGNSNGKYDITYGEDVVKFLLKEIESEKQYGARPINRAIEKHLATPLSLMVITGEFQEGYTFKISVNPENNELVIK